jgi:hypothetical protein
MYAAGEGVPRDHVRAYVWFRVAAAGLTGSLRDTAVTALDRTSRFLSPEQRTRAQTLATTCFNSNFADCGEP